MIDMFVLIFGCFEKNPLTPTTEMLLLRYYLGNFGDEHGELKATEPWRWCSCWCYPPTKRDLWQIDPKVAVALHLADMSTNDVSRDNQ